MTAFLFSSSIAVLPGPHGGLPSPRPACTPVATPAARVTHRSRDQQSPDAARTAPPGRTAISDGRSPARSRTRSDAGRLHAAQLLLELADLVPQPGGDLELQLRRGRVHLLGELAGELQHVPAGLALLRAGVAPAALAGLRA